MSNHSITMPGSSWWDAINAKGIHALLNWELIRIFEQMDNKELCKSKKVCRKWRLLIDQHVGLELYFSPYKGYSPYIWTKGEENDKRFRGIRAIKGNGIRTVYLSFAHDVDYDYERKDPLEFKCPDTLRKLWIDGNPPAPYLDTIFNTCTNIRKLAIHLWSSALNSTFKLPRLECLTISMYGIYDEESYIEHNGLKAQTVIDFLRRIDTLSDYLEEIGLQVPMDVRKGVLGAEIIRLVLRHETLRRLKIQLEEGENIDATNEEIQRFSDEASVIQSTIEIGDFEFDNNLEEVFLHCQAIARNHLVAAQLLEFLNNVKPALKKLHLSLGYQPLPLTLISSSAKTLNFVELAVTTRHHTQPVNLTPFAPCPNLETLKLMGPSIGVEEREQTFPDLTNLDALPPSLKELELMNLRIRKQDGQHISRLTNLQKVVLSKIATTERYGLLIEDAALVIGNPKLMRFLVVGAVNGNSLANEEFWEMHPGLETYKGLLSATDGLYWVFDETSLPTENNEPESLNFTLENGLFGDNDEDEEEEESAEEEEDEEIQEEMEEANQEAVEEEEEIYTDDEEDSESDEENEGEEDSDDAEEEEEDDYDEEEDEDYVPVDSD